MQYVLKFRLPTKFLVAAFSAIFAALSIPSSAKQDQAAAISIKKMQTASGNHYTLIIQGPGSIAKWTLERPNMKSGKIVLSIPAAFTEHFGGVHGIYALDGKVRNQESRDENIGGAVIIADGICKIAAAPRGQIDSASLASTISHKGSFFQQFQVVANGKPEGFRDRSKFQRRGIAVFPDGKTAILESLEPMTLNQFGIDAAALGVYQLAYTDMGPWDEGWYRDPASGKIVVIGQDRSLTYRQSNWFILQRTE